jgi:hypothetical protein
MTTSPSSSFVSRRAALAGLGAGGLGVAMAARALNASAQDAMDPATHLLAGVWQWNAYPEQPELSNFAIFHPSGTYTEWQPVAGEAIGLWRPTGERTADLMFIFTDANPAIDVYEPGIVTFTITIEIDETGDALAAEGTIDVRDPGGVQRATVPFRRPATRLTFDSNPTTGSIPATPASGTPSS